MLFKNKNARAVLATALAVITIFMLTLSVSAAEARECVQGGVCLDDDGDGFCDKCDTVFGEHEHDYIITDSERATCTENGYNNYQCTLCLETYTEILTAGHSYSDGVCTVCGDTCSHSGTSTIVSYEDEKTHNARCDDCGAIFYEAHTYVNGVCPCGKTGVCDGTHAWTEDPQTEVDATAHTEGWREWICQRCGESRKTIIEAEHMMQKGTHPATCTEDGYIIYTCMEGCDYEYKETLPALGGSHSWSDWEAGLIDGCNRHYSRSCSVCGASDTKVEKVHYFNGGASVCACGEYTCIHDWAGCNVLSTPTCTTAGVTEFWCISCQNNGYIADKVERIEAFGHSYENGVCTVCGDTDPDVGGDTDPDEEEHIHNYVLGGGYSATCTESGKWWYECESCGDIKEEYPSATGHSYGEEHRSESTENCIVYYTKYCQNGSCDHYEQRTEKVHSFADGATTCNCGETTRVHTFGEWKLNTYNDTLCRVEQYYRTCSGCGFVETKTETIHIFDGRSTICKCGKITHNHTLSYTGENYKPTCTTTGKKTMWCEYCYNTYGAIVRVYEETPALGHGDTYWKSTGNDSCFEYCGRCNVRVDVMNHFGSSDPATPCVKEYSATQIISGHYCDRCKTYIYTQESKIALENVLVVTIDENYGTRQQFDYDAFMTYKYIYIENKRADYVSSFTFEVRSAKNMSVRFDAILNYIINGNDAILIDIEDEQIYSHEKKHRVETVTLTGYEAWKQYGDVYRAESMKQFDRYWQKGSFPSGSVFKLDIDATIHGDIIVSNKYTADVPFLYLTCGVSSQPVRLKGYNGDLSTFLENLKKSPINVILEYDEQTVKQFDGSALQFFRTLKADHDSSMSSNEYAQGFNDAIQSVINENPVQGFFQGIWSAMVLFFTILGSGITIGGITLSSVFYTIALVVIVSFVVRLLR